MTTLPNCIPAPSWQQMFNWIRDPIDFQRTYRQQFGDVFTMNLIGLGRCVLIGEPRLVQDVFNRTGSFDVGRGNSLAIPLVGEHSIMLLDGDRHRRARKLLMPPFHGERLHTYATQICDITQQIAAQWQPGDGVVARNEMQRISLEVILQVVFGLREGDRYEQLKPLLTDWLNMTDSPWRSSILFFKTLQKDWGTWSPWGRMKQRQAAVHALLQAEIDDRRQQLDPTQTDILSLLLATRDEAGQPMSDAEIRDELLTLLFAGHETTATMLAWALYEILRRPDVQAKLQAELATVDAPTDPMAIAKLPYLNAICQEILRLYPVLPVLFPRLTKAETQIGDYTFPPDTVLMVSIYLVHTRADIYPQPHDFQPDRFLEQTYAPQEFLPFGGGNRRCIGYALAQLEMKLVLATLMRQTSLQLASDRTVTIQRRGFTLAPKGGVVLRRSA